MNYIPLIALAVSAIALVISALSLWFSRRAQHHTQIVSFEQRRQEVRQTLFESQLLIGEIDHALYRLEDTKSFRNTVAAVAVTRNQYKDTLKEFDRLPPSPSTEARLLLEQTAAAAHRIKNETQEILKMVHAVNNPTEFRKFL